MSLWERRPLRTVKHVLGWVLRPRLSYLRLREILRARKAGPVKAHIALDSLPSIKLIPAESGELLAEVVDVYVRNPSRMNIAPRSTEAMAKLVAEGYEYYLIADPSGSVIGALSWHAPRAMACHLAVDFAQRSGGFGLAGMVALEQLKARQGHRKSYGQVLKNNRRALSTFLSVGYKIDGEDPEGVYYEISKDLTPPDEPQEH